MTSISNASANNMVCKCNIIPVQDIPAINISFAVINAIIGVMAVVGNIGVIHAIRLNQDFHSCTYALIVNLAIGNIMMGLITQPLNITILLTDKTRMCLWNKMDFFFGILSVYGTGITIALISTDRCLNFFTMFRKKDVYGKIINCKTTAVLISMTWLISLGMAIFGICGESTPFHNTDFAFLVFLVSIMTICYVYIYKFVSVNQTKPEDLNKDKYNIKKLKHSTRTAKAVSVIIATFLWSWLPYAILLQIWVRKGDRPAISIAFPIINALGLSNSAINPWLYFWKHRGLRRSMMAYFCWLKPFCCVGKWS